MERSIWENHYRRYRTLKKTWHCPGAPDVFSQKAFNLILTSPKDPEQLAARELRQYGFELPDDNQWKEALALREVILSLPDGWFADQPLEDVYQAALRMETYQSTWDENTYKDRLYRGQRNFGWKLLPKMFRPKISTDLAVTHAEQIQQDLLRIEGLVRQLQANGHKITDEEGVAIFQHYSQEAGVGTWLIDMTWDPFVALFFASDGGISGQTGIISYLGKEEWEKFSAGGTNRLGAVRAIEPKGVPRIEAQRATFLDTSHPDLYEQFVPHSLYFKQKADLVFEDVDRDPPVSKNYIYPDGDAYRDEILRLKPAENFQPLDFQPISDVHEALSADEYTKIAMSWLAGNDEQLVGILSAIISIVCDIYAELQRKAEKVDITYRSLHKLQRIINYIFVMAQQDKKTSLRDLINLWISNEGPLSEEEMRVKKIIEDFVY